jgi:hypothetical protein
MEERHGYRMFAIGSLPIVRIKAAVYDRCDVYFPQLLELRR